MAWLGLAIDYIDLVCEKTITRQNGFRPRLNLPLLQLNVGKNGLKNNFKSFYQEILHTDDIRQILSGKFLTCFEIVFPQQISFYKV